LEKKHMLRLLKSLPLVLALAALSIFASCGGNGDAQVRVVHAIPDATGLDVTVNGNKVFTDVLFGGVQPTPPAYTSVGAGSSTVEAFVSGQTSNPVVQGTGSLSGGSQYTLLLNGFEAQNEPIAFIPDNNTAPTSGSVAFRIINASPSSPESGVDVYIVAPGSELGPGVTPQISALGFAQSSGYITLPFAPTGYTLIVTPNGNQSEYINQTYTFGSSSAGAIRSFVVVDVLNGGRVSPFPLELDDLN
jgi:Domain of unknown function (DUF4397)